MASIKDVAKQAGVSIATVSRVINGTKFVSPDVRQSQSSITAPTRSPAR